MHTENNKKVDEVPDVPDDLPFISLIIPFEPRMNTKTGFDCIVNAAADKIKRELINSYPEDKAMPVVQKLYRVLMGLDHKANNKRIAIFVSPLVEKVYYFTYSEEEKIIYKKAI